MTFKFLSKICTDLFVIHSFNLPNVEYVYSVIKVMSCYSILKVGRHIFNDI